MRATWWIIGGVGLVALLLWSRKSAASVAGGDSEPGTALLQDVLTMVGPRGIRNNNPGNIREGEGDLTYWQGERATNDDPAYEEFDTPEDGIRAMAVVINNYRRLYGRNTIRKIVTRWAPANENDLVAYIAAVSNSTGIGPDQQITDADMPALIAAIIKHENGVQPYTFAQIEQGVSRA